MDPQATLRTIMDASGDELREACENLIDWIQRGGFLPSLDHTCARAGGCARCIMDAYEDAGADERTAMVAWLQDMSSEE